MPKVAFLGHPVHPQLIVAPAALFPFTFVLDLLFRTTGKRSFRHAALYSLTGGVVGALGAGTTGALDYLEIPADSEEKKLANVHAALNLGLLGAAAANLAMRWAGADARDRLPFALSALAAVGVIASGWYGGHLVYRHGVRVRENLDEPDVRRLPMDKRAEA